MNREKREILDMYRFQLIHYCKKGMGAKSDISKNTIITPILVKSCLDRYIELGGDENFNDMTDERYKDFLSEFL